VEILSVIYFFPIIPILLALLVGVPYLYLNNRTKPIDHLKYPTLSRAHKIIRYRNVTAREKEARKRELEAKSEVAAIEARAFKESEENLKQVRAKQNAAKVSWDEQWSVLIAPSVIKQKAIERQKEVDAYRKRQELQQLEYREMLAATEARSNVWQRPSNRPDDSSYGDRMVGVHVANLRKFPSTTSGKVGRIVQGEKISIDAWAIGEDQYGNNIWFRLKAMDIWIWSGALTNQSTSGLLNLSSQYKFYRSSTAARYHTPLPPVGSPPLNSLWFDTSDHNRAYKWDGDFWQPVSPVRAGMNASRITTGMITADKITAAGGLTVPRETSYSVPLPPSFN
jgi:hypothetical protein